MSDETHDPSARLVFVLAYSCRFVNFPDPGARRVQRILFWITTGLLLADAL